MSMKKRRQQAAEAAEVEEQEATIRQKFKKQRITDDVGQIQAENFFQPITRRMAAPLARSAPEGPKEPIPGPDYGIDEEE